MTVGGTAPAALRSCLRSSSGLRVRIGPFLVCVRSSLKDIERSLRLLYSEFAVEPEGGGAHFSMRVDPPSLARRLFRAQVQFDLDGRQPFIPLPKDRAALMFEAGLNWCVGTLANQFVVIHAATLERNGRALLMPAPPGSGKSTLCAGLVARGWRLLSDEFALVDPGTRQLTPLPRPVALKNGSIDVIRTWAPDLVFGPAVLNNEGQLVAYVRPPDASVHASDRRCHAGLVVIPQWVAGVEATITPMTRARAVLHLADNSYNHNLHGREGFDCLAEIGGTAPCVTLRYSRLAEGVEAVNRLADWGSA